MDYRYVYLNKIIIITELLQQPFLRENESRVQSLRKIVHNLSNVLQSLKYINISGLADADRMTTGLWFYHLLQIRTFTLHPYLSNYHQLLYHTQTSI